MPNATISTEYSDPIPLKSLDDAWITVRPLPYGKKMERRDKASKMYMEWSASEGKQVSADELSRVSIEFLNKWSAIFDMTYCIGDHNLEDSSGKKLDLSSPMALDILHPRVGTEIETILAKLNGDEDEGELSDFFSQQSTVSEESSHLTTPPATQD